MNTGITLIAGTARMFDDQLESFEEDEVIIKCINNDIQLLIEAEENRHQTVTHLLDGLQAYKAFLDNQALEANRRFLDGQKPF